MNKFLTGLLIVLFSFSPAGLLLAQGQEDIEIYIIDSYISPEAPYVFNLTFFTTDSVISKVIIENTGEFIISKKPEVDHKFEKDVTELKTNGKYLRYRIEITDRNGNKIQSPPYEAEFPHNIVMKDRNLNLLQVCCFGGVIFGLPSPVYIRYNEKDYFGLSKEIPLFSFYSGGYNYPLGYVGVEYTYVFNKGNPDLSRDFIRVGYKQIIQLPAIEYISLGISYFNDFKGSYGYSPELSLGLFKIENVFTFYARYRYSNGISGGNYRFNEYSVGIYSNFFSINF
ncbi:hypothetical protein ACSSWA_12860 [Melioribacter sp. Ez-97]|uniref:hypothetical protein n=1 Tax=Melioribacter sp. Ez-97 TaxID=3423434 RepID=UPI003ED8DF70